MSAAPDTAAASAASDTTAASAAPASAAPPRSRARRIGLVLLGVAIALVVVVGVVAVWAAGSAGSSGQHSRSPDDPAPGGAMALAQVLEQQGVEVSITSSFWQTRDAVGDGDDVLLLVDDDWWVLTDEAYARVRELSRHILLVQPTDVALERLAPGVDYAGFGGGELTADCELRPVRRAETVDAGGDAYTAPASADRCLATDDDGYGLVRVENDGVEVTVLGLGEVLENRRITASGNAALALGLLGSQPRLVWYHPDVDDYAFEETGSLASLQAAWFAPLVVLLLLVGVAAAVWRGRRMGPVVVERLPVEVRSSETMEGRARLYERGGAREHALATLRRATLTRLAGALGLGRLATPDEIIVAAASATGRDPASVAALLGARPAGDDRGLVRLSDELLRLEQDVARAVRPS